MKKFTFLMAFLMMFSVMAKSQYVVADFEHLRLNLMKGGEEDNSSFRVVPNPDKGDANPSEYVVKFHRSQHGVAWGGFFAFLPEDAKIDLTTDKYIHAQVWKTRISPVKFKIEAGTTPNIEIASINPQTLTEEWETMVFHFSEATGEYGTVVFMPDFNDPVDLTEDIVIYFDNIYVSNSPDVGSTPTQVIENFETIKMNVMAAGDNAHFHVVPNPDQSEGYESAHVVEFKRGVGDPWGGFWSPLPEPLDLSVHKYVYVDVWKPRISPLKFKIEGGPAANTEVASMKAQTKVNEWETMVFDFSSVDGQWATIVFMPDFEDPLTLTEDILIYFDNIRVGDAPFADEPIEVDFVWCDFEDGFTNVGGFREVINTNSTATDLPGEGMDGGTALLLVYEATEAVPNTGYQMWSFPDKINVSGFTHFVIHIKADSPIENADIVLRDDVTVNGRSHHTVNIGTEWEQILISLEDFTALDDFNAADLTILHLIQLFFRYEVTSENQGNVYIDLVGFADAPGLSVPQLNLNDFEVRVFPNPASNNLEVRTVSGSTVSLINLNGSIVDSRIAGNETVMFDVSNLPKGIYLVRVVNKGAAVTRKVIVY